jgi:hypothetical protein
VSRRAIIWTVAVALLLVAAMAYGSSRQRDDATDDTVAVAESTSTTLNAHAEPTSTTLNADDDATDDMVGVAESMLTAFNADDYETFTSRFTPAYLAEMDEAAFEEWRAPLVETFGRYQEITDTRVTKGNDSDAVRYVFTVSFEKDAAARFSITLKPGSTRINRVDLKPAE